MTEPLTEPELAEAREYFLGLRLCRECSGRIRLTGKESRRVLCDDCRDTRDLAQMRRASKYMVEVLKEAGPDPDPEELGKALALAARRALKEEP